VTAEIITIGDELLIGQVINTNAAWMAAEFNRAGISIYQVTTISDDRNHIISALNEASRRSNLIFLTGGLGPTKDDITKQTLCEYFNTHLVFDQKVYDNILKLFGSRGLKVNELNRRQAEIPGNCKPVENKNGTAPGMWFEKAGIIYISMPGVPYEMKEMVTNQIIPELIKRFNPEPIVHKTILTNGIPESVLAKQIEDWEDHLPSNIKLAYLPQPGAVRLRLTAKGGTKSSLEKLISDEIIKLQKIIPENISGYDNEALNEIIGNLLRKSGKTLSTAESCTGGYIAHLITLVPGSSEYFKGSVIAYSNELKESMLDISKEALLKYGAVSEEVVKAMANEVRRKLNSDYSIATSGIAGPGGGTIQKPVGTTWIAIATPEFTTSKYFLMGEHRESNIKKTAQAALNMLRKAILTCT
jgi:nicotinamide-nucleotide amidase